MSALPRMTVRLSPSMLHAVAYCAERAGMEPAVWARVTLVAAARDCLREHGWERDQQAAYMDWLALQAREAAGQAEVPGQAAYDELASGTPLAHERDRALDAAAEAARPIPAPMFEGAPSWQDPSLEQPERRLQELFGRAASGRPRS